MKQDVVQLLLFHGGRVYSPLAAPVQPPSTTMASRRLSQPRCGVTAKNAPGWVAAAPPGGAFMANGDRLKLYLW